MSRALGRALADTSGERAAWRVAVAIAVATLALSLNVVTAVYAQYQGRFDRDAARTAILSGDSDFAAPDAGPTIAYQVLQDGRAGWDYVDVVILAVTDETAPPPPGLPRWPAPGEVFTSQALLDYPDGRALANEYGRVAGTIAEDVLADPGERLIYVGADVEALAGAPEISGFGVEPQSVRADSSLGWVPSYATLVNTMQTMRGWWAGVALFLVAPSVVFLFVSTRLGAERREGRLAVLRALGASPRQVRSAILADVLPPAALGTGAALALSMLACAGTWHVPFLDQAVVGADLRAAAGWLVAGPLLALAALVATALVSYGAARTSPFGTRPVARPRRAARWPIGIVLASVIVANYGYSYFFRAGDPALGVAVVVGCAAVAGLSVTGLTSALIHRSGVALVRWSASGRGRAAALVAGRELTSAGRPVVRATASITLMAILVAHAWVLMAMSGAEQREAVLANNQNADRMLELQVGDPDVNLPLVGALLPDGVALLQIDGGWGEPKTVYGTCEHLEATLGACDAVRSDTPLPVRQVQPLAAGDVTLLPLDEPGTGPRTLQTVLVSTNDQPIDRRAVRSVIRTEVTPVVDLGYYMEDWVVMAVARQDQARWILAAGACGLTIVLSTTGFALSFEALRTSRKFASLGVLEGRSGFYRRLGLWIAGLPILAAVTAGTVVAMLQVATEIALDEEVAPPWGAVLILVCLGIVAAVASGFVSGEVTRRAAHRWQSDPAD